MLHNVQQYKSIKSIINDWLTSPINSQRLYTLLCIEIHRSFFVQWSFNSSTDILVLLSVIMSHLSLEYHNNYSVIPFFFADWAVFRFLCGCGLFFLQSSNTKLVNSAFDLLLSVLCSTTVSFWSYRDLLTCLLCLRMLSWEDMASTNDSIDLDAALKSYISETRVVVSNKQNTIGYCVCVVYVRVWNECDALCDSLYFNHHRVSCIGSGPPYLHIINYTELRT